jgi:hypothetical protein
VLLHSSPLFSIYFGNADDALFPEDYLHYPAETRLLTIDPYKKLKKLLFAERLYFLKQTHSVAGVEIAKQDLPSFSIEGDYLLTQEKKVGLGIMTADCLPIILYDTLHYAVAIVHAGLRGAVAGIAPKVALEMQERYGTKFEHLRIFFGPSIKSCCYAVNGDFLSEVERSHLAEQVLYQEERGVMFDLPLFNRLLLEEIGIPKEAFKLDYNFCTSCDTRYCSHRRDGIGACRQMTVVALK